MPTTRLTSVDMKPNEQLDIWVREHNQAEVLAMINIKILNDKIIISSGTQSMVVYAQG